MILLLSVNHWFAWAERAGSASCVVSTLGSAEPSAMTALSRVMVAWDWAAISVSGMAGAAVGA